MVDSAPHAQLWWVSLGHTAVSESKETCTDYCRLVQRTNELTCRTSTGCIWGNYQKRKRKKKASTQMKFSNSAKQPKLISGCLWGMVAGNTWEGVLETFWGDGHSLHLGSIGGDMHWSKSIELDIQDLYIYFKRKKM